jgi:hypothetical protein
LGYGRFSVAQILSLVVGLDPESDDFVKLTATRLDKATDAMEALLKKAGEIERVTYAAKGDVVEDARKILRRAVSYAESRENGNEIAADMLRGDNLSTVLRRRPVKLVAALDRVSDSIEKYKSSLSEYMYWQTHVKGARDALANLNEDVRKARVERRSMTPEVAAGREAWLTRYGATKTLVLGILRAAGKAELMPLIFDDLAEVHRVAGVSDEVPAGEGEAPQIG